MKKTCKVPNKGSGYCRSVKNNGCSGGKFYSGFCPGNSDIRCGLKGRATSPAPTTCKVPKAGSGNCRSVKKDGCSGGKFYTGYCPGNSDNKCCVKTAASTSTCSVPKVGSGNCQSVKKKGCPDGKFYTGYCPGNSDNKCCVKNGVPTTGSSCTAAALDKLLFSDSISTFLKAKKAKKPSCFDWSDDGCSCSPDQLGNFDFLPSCKRHDFGYRNSKNQGRFGELKTRIDDNFKDDLYDVCKKFKGLKSLSGVECRRIADLYVKGVRKYGNKMKRDQEVGAMNDLRKRECDLAELLGF